MNNTNYEEIIKEKDELIAELINQRDAYKFICKKICEEYEEEKSIEEE